MRMLSFGEYLRLYIDKIKFTSRNLVGISLLCVIFIDISGIFKHVCKKIHFLDF